MYELCLQLRSLAPHVGGQAAGRLVLSLLLLELGQDACENATVGMLAVVQIVDLAAPDNNLLCLLEDPRHPRLLTPGHLFHKADGWLEVRAPGPARSFDAAAERGLNQGCYGRPRRGGQGAPLPFKRLHTRNAWHFDAAHGHVPVLVVPLEGLIHLQRTLPGLQLGHVPIKLCLEEPRALLTAGLVAAAPLALQGLEEFALAHLKLGLDLEGNIPRTLHLREAHALLLEEELVPYLQEVRLELLVFAGFQGLQHIPGVDLSHCLAEPLNHLLLPHLTPSVCLLLLALLLFHHRIHCGCRLDPPLLHQIVEPLLLLELGQLLEVHVPLGHVQAL
mmetsp:Transcript_7062/g.19107  ORF Transcript_7062/g.19107 Transcript_7062/m.19107 type:complete len:333 (-) Transcript_7062:316-1314(-)